MVGTRIGDRYEIQHELGRGGMGVVYLASDPLLQRNVAIKLLSPGIAHPDVEERFKREARIIARLDHTGIVPVHDTGIFKESLFFVMPYVEGSDLRTYLDYELLPVESYIPALMQIADALDYAHSRGIVHRDIKPENILLSQESGKIRARLTDFGLALILTENRITKSGQVAGTINYLSPEQILGHNIDFRSDLYSLGVVMYECLCGHPPFLGDFQSVLNQIANDAPPPLPYSGELSRELEPLILRCLSKAPDDRPQSGKDISAELEKILAKSIPTTTAHEPSVRASIHVVEKHPVPDNPEILMISPARHQKTGNLPVPLTKLIGREEELVRLRNLMSHDHTRLLTLTGSGGSGKTRLALELAHNAASEFPDGVYYVSLASLRDPLMVPSQILHELEPVEHQEEMNFLRETLQNRKALLLLDNFEHLISAGPVLSEILSRCPHIKIIVTSREVLKITAEQEFPVPPLPAPDPTENIPPELLRHYPAIELFKERAHTVKPDFQFNAENAHSIAEICRILDGIPLAIELAAARIKVLSPQEILKRLKKPLQFLSGGSRDLPERQHTMQKTIDWGYNLLGEEDKSLYRHLCIFDSGFTIESAEAVCEKGLPYPLIDGIGSLVDKSLIQEQENQRFRILEVIRQYGLEKLEESGEIQEFRSRHSEHFMKLAEIAHQELDESGNENWVKQLATEHDNLLLAIEWILEHGSAKSAVQFTGALWWFWYLHGHYAEGGRLLDSALALTPVTEDFFRARALHGAGTLAFLRCEYSKAQNLLESSVTISRKINSTKMLAYSLHVLGSIAREQGDYDHAITLHHVTIPLWQELGDQRGIARALNAMGLASWLNCAFEQTRKHCEESLAAFRAIGDKEGIAWALLNLGIANHYMDQQNQASQYCKESLAISREIGFKEGVAWNMNILGNVAALTGNIDRSQNLFKKCLEMHWKLGDKWRSASAMEAIAHGFAISKDWRTAVQILAATDRLRKSIGTPVPPVEEPLLNHTLEALHPHQSHPDYQALWNKGAHLNFEQVVHLIVHDRIS